ncbi:MAG: enterochelin esterase [Cellvibrio sp.]|uniref:enterochelin esterase n=1 Tax=Cellvibrio sp. TaxID=1965322 RepID=UPI0031A4D918
MNLCISPDSLTEQTELLFERADLGSPAWWQDITRIGTPLRGAHIGETVELTFLWRGTPAQVFIDVYSHTPHIIQSLTALTRIGQTDVWYWRTRLPVDWCGSYFLLPVEAEDLPPPEHGRERRHWWIDLMERQAQADSFNLYPPHNSGWGLPLSAIQLQPARALPEVITPVQIHHERWLSRRLGNERSIWLYDSGKDNAGDKPLVILLDGHYWANHQPLLSELDALTQSGVLPAAQYLFIDALSPRARADEMPCNPTFWYALQQELLPRLQKRFSLTQDPHKTLIAGQSFGGLAAAYAVLHWPERFGIALSQSGSFWWPDADEAGDKGELTQAVLAGQGQGATLRIHLDIGCYEQDMLGVNRALCDALIATGHKVSYREFRGGHDWLCWSEGLVSGLISLLGSPAPDTEFSPA